MSRGFPFSFLSSRLTLAFIGCGEFYITFQWLCLMPCFLFLFNRFLMRRTSRLPVGADSFESFGKAGIRVSPGSFCVSFASKAVPPHYFFQSYQPTFAILALTFLTILFCNGIGQIHIFSSWASYFFFRFSVQKALIVNVLA